MLPELKLTKKQKKGIAFRERRGKSGHSRDTAKEPTDIPEPEIQDAPEKISDEQALKLSEVPERNLGNKKRKRAPEDGQVPGVNEDPDGVSPKVKSKKRKTAKIADDSNGNDVSEGGAKLKRFILFVGNLPYTISKEQILEHFSECNPAPAIRLLTPKSRTGKPQTAVQAAKSKGCAFLEFSSHSAMQVAIQKHHSELAGRQINVELTAGGGGNSGQRKEKLRTRNHTLNEQRKRGAERRNPKGSGLGDHERPQSRLSTRHSTTSGETQANNRPKTWSIPATENHKAEPRKTRGKSKGAKAVQRKPSWAPSGANAIKVG
ncbi:unnamed protein product [Rhizoctonia solani]|uniref:RRM domain-containing protein n=3 Tax=Rhizoctonia solani TaxID=456999 RepID=A0A8H3HIX0_9AGAM|nr:RNA recognition motif protein [Rhizoctonia solani AG-3 Rhs1AP]KEP51784.1 RNA recognition motif protein [Rhizoctonia solani 123E]CAE6487142.1 unnamed protein product [Rhizoctonia solani]CAE6535865.1 unnamed protein product [Rhizoctonia solani]